MADKPIDVASDPEKIKEISEGLTGLTGENDKLTEAQYQNVVAARQLVALLERQTELYQKLQEQKANDIANIAGRGDLRLEEKEAEIAVIEE